MLAMLDALAKSGHQGQVNWFHAAENGDVHAFADEVKALGRGAAGVYLSRLVSHPD